MRLQAAPIRIARGARPERAGALPAASAPAPAPGGEGGEGGEALTIEIDGVSVGRGQWFLHPVRDHAARCGLDPKQTRCPRFVWLIVLFAAASFVCSSILLFLRSVLQCVLDRQVHASRGGGPAWGASCRDVLELPSPDSSRREFRRNAHARRPRRHRTRRRRQRCVGGGGARVGRARRPDGVLLQRRGWPRVDQLRALQGHHRAPRVGALRRGDEERGAAVLGDGGRVPRR